ncbi:MAG TPA: hypothetical protein VN881_07375 [Candidatus Acidoferrales bacterium]|nr:hypothetical protein [Candidatus Acidoferrales bacterium]
MLQIKNTIPGNRKIVTGSFLLICLLSSGSSPIFSQDRPKPETIEATAMGTDTQAGKEFSVTLTIYQYSPRADKQILIDAFQNGKDQGLCNALSKMKAVGHIAVTGTIGYDVSYIQMTPTPTGRKIRFVTNRLLRFGEVYWDTRSSSYNLTVGELDLNDVDKSKSTGFLYPEAELVINKQGELQWNLVGSPWKLFDIIDWKGTPGVD